MRIADLYIRVSTDEQADKGYSQRDQEDRLRRYCDLHNFNIRKVIYEDHSAKTFKRPAWSHFLSELRKHRGESDLVLFTKWDRFSRNAADAYQMLSTLKSLQVEPQAIEQPLDLEVPENKMMLAIYLAAPEVENDRRALNVTNGMRRAKKEGRLMGIAPLGYSNKVDETGRKYIAVREDEAVIVRWVFNELATGIWKTEQLWRDACKRGLHTSKNNFWVLIRNAAYCGKIFIPKYKDEESHYVKGQHEPLISEELFYKVQEVLDGRKYKLKSKTRIKVDPNIPLRGFLLCPKCGSKLSGSASKGRTAYYYYYHCTKLCGLRHKANEVNDGIITEIRHYVDQLGDLKLFRELVIATFNSKTRDQRSDIGQLKEDIEKAQSRLSKARDLLLSGELDPVDYRIIKVQTEENVNRMEVKLLAAPKPEKGLDILLDRAVSNISNLDQLYVKGDVLQRRKIIGSVFPEKLTFCDSGFRTTKINEALQLMLLINSNLKGKKKGTIQSVSELSQDVTSTGFKPVTF